MIARYILYTLVWILAAIVGIFGGYHLARYFGIGENIWGNSVDGYCGDKLYKESKSKSMVQKVLGVLVVVLYQESCKQPATPYS